MGEKMKILQVHHFYDLYMKKFYETHPELNNAAYTQQMVSILDDGFSAGHLLTSYLEQLGHETKLVIANYLPAQLKWMREHNETFQSPENWLFHPACITRAGFL